MRRGGWLSPGRVVALRNRDATVVSGVSGDAPDEGRQGALDHDTLPPAPGEAAPARRRWVLVTVAAMLLVVLGAASADGDVRGAGRGDYLIRPAYQGHLLTTADVAALRAQGRAVTSALNRELACQGVELYFDTTDERDAYLADYLSRFPAEPPYLTGDPCRPFRDSPRYIVGE